MNALPDALGTWYWVISIMLGVAAAWTMARLVWSDESDDVFDRAVLLVVMPLMGGGIVFLAWQILVVVAVAAGLVWLFAQSAKPGRVRLPKRKPRASLEARIAELEAELDMRESP